MDHPILSGIIAFAIPFLICYFGRRISKKHRVFLFIIYSIFILYETIFTRSIGTSRTIEMMPFWSYGQIHSVPMRNEVLLNIFLFIPFGFLLPWATKLSFKKTLLIGFIFSTLIEATQYIFYLGLCEFDDVFHNTLGTSMGYWYWRGLEYLSKRIRENNI